MAQVTEMQVRTIGVTIQGTAVPLTEQVLHAGPAMPLGHFNPNLWVPFSFYEVGTESQSQFAQNHPGIQTW